MGTGTSKTRSQSPFFESLVTMNTAMLFSGRKKRLIDYASCAG